MFNFLDARPAIKFGSEMAHIYIEKMPPTLALKQKQFALKSTRVLEQISLKIISYKNFNSINTYKVAQMANSFKWDLKDAGYEDDYINQLTQWFITSVKK